MRPFPRPLHALTRVDEFFASRHGYRLCSSTWKPPPGVPVRGAVLMCHGYTDYLGPHWDHWASLLSHQGLVCFGLEHHGHGRSDGLPAFVPSFDAVVTDYLDWAAVIRGRVLPSIVAASSQTEARPADDAPPAALPLFLLAESMGGAIAVLAASRAKPGSFTGVVLLAPMLGIDAVRRPAPAIESIARRAGLARRCGRRRERATRAHRVPVQVPGPHHPLGAHPTARGRHGRRVLQRPREGKEWGEKGDDMDVACFGDPNEGAVLLV